MRKKHIIIIVLVAFLAGYGLLATNESGNLYQLLKNFNYVLKLVQENYVQELNPSDLVRSAIRGMLSKLDPHSVYLTQRDYRELRIHTTGKYGGLGFVVGRVKDVITVISPFEGTPAYRAGLQPGDRIIKIDEIPTAGMGVDEAVSKMRGTPGTSVNLTIEREGVEGLIDFHLVREIIELKNVQYFGLINPDIGYIRVSGFSEGVGAEVRVAIDSLLAQGVKKLILDLRTNPGGLLEQAVEVADNFLPSGKLIVSTKGRVAKSNRDYYSTHESKTQGFPLVILVNKASASASEIVAGAIQDWDIGLVVGDTTFGKGSVQTVIPIEGNEAVKLTTARYYIPSGRCIDISDTTQFLLKNPTIGKKFNSLGGLNREFVSNGSIVPDTVLESEKTLPIITEIQRNGLFMQYTSKWVREHPKVQKGFEISPQMLQDFKAFIKNKGMKFTDSEFDSATKSIKQIIKSMIAQDKWGAKGQYEVLLSEDPWIQFSSKLLSKARSDKDLFKLVGVK
ncbi:MAG: S41 family peptidase [bacterium]|nr:S41 family peptidase [bacterium]